MRRSAPVVLVLLSLARASWGVETPPDAASALDRGTPDDAAKSKFAAALKLHAGGQFEQALAVFRQLVEETGSPNARLYVGLCLEQLGKSAEAYRELARTSKEATLRADAKYDRTRDAAQAEMTALDARVGRLVISLLDTPAGVAVAVDGAALAEREVGTPIVLAPGTHHVEASAPGRRTAARDVHLDGGETRTMTLALGDADAARDQAERSAGTPLLRVAGYASAGIAVAGVSMFVVGGILASGRYGTLQDACGESRCTDPRYLDDIDAGKAAQTLANVGLIMGLAGAALSATFLLVDSKSQARLAAQLNPGAAHVRYQLAF